MPHQPHRTKLPSAHQPVPFQVAKCNGDIRLCFLLLLLLPRGPAAVLPTLHRAKAVTAICRSQNGWLQCAQNLASAGMSSSNATRGSRASGQQSAHL